MLMGVPDDWVVEEGAGRYPGHMMLISDGEGEGAREDTLLPASDELVSSQLCSNRKTSSLDGPAFRSAENEQECEAKIISKLISNSKCLLT